MSNVNTSSIKTLMMLLFIASLVQVGMDLYTPSLPAIAKALNTNVNATQFSLSIFILAVAISQFIYGVLSDALGRKIILLIGIPISLIGCVICVMANNIEMLLIGRFIQGFGAGACASQWRAIFRDIYKGEMLAKMGSYLGNFVVFSVIAAPFIGGYLQKFFGWKANFIFLTSFTLILLLMVILFYQETSQHHSLSRLKLGFVINAYKRLFTNRIYMGSTICCLLTYGSLLAWLTSGPIIVIHLIGKSPVVFGHLMIFMGLSMLISAIANGKLVTKLGIACMVRIGWGLVACAGIIMIIENHFFQLTLYSIVPPVIVFYLGSTLIWSNIFATAMEPFADIAGYAGSVYSGLQISGGALFSTILAHIIEKNQMPLAILFIISGVGSWLIFELMVRPALKSS